METAPQRYTQVAPLYRREVRDAFPVVAAVHALAAELAVPRLTDKDFKALRAANRRFAEALERDRVDAALAEDDAFHAIFVDAAANGEIPRVLDRLMPRIRRLERLRFGSLAGRDSVRQHDGIIAAAAAGESAKTANAGSRELALPRNPDRPELRMTATARPENPRSDSPSDRSSGRSPLARIADIHDAETLAAARALLDAAADPAAMQREVLAAVARNERWRGNECINLLAPEALVSPTVRQLLSAEVGQRAAEGHIGPVNRWFAGTRHIDEIEALCVELLKRLFRPTTPSTGWSPA